jgi:hypothetical protein
MVCKLSLVSSESSRWRGTRQSCESIDSSPKERSRRLLSCGRCGGGAHEPVLVHAQWPRAPANESDHHPQTVGDGIPARHDVRDPLRWCRSRSLPHSPQKHRGRSGARRADRISHCCDSCVVDSGASCDHRRAAEQRHAACSSGDAGHVSRPTMEMAQRADGRPSPLGRSSIAHPCQGAAEGVLRSSPSAHRLCQSSRAPTASGSARVLGEDSSPKCTGTNSDSVRHGFALRGTHGRAFRQFPQEEASATGCSASTRERSTPVARTQPQRECPMSAIAIGQPTSS